MRTGHALAVLLALVFFAISISTPDANAQTINQAGIGRIDNWNGFNSEYGEAILDITLGAVPVYVNVVADLNGDGNISNYGIGLGTQAEWIVQNMRLPVNSGHFWQVASIFPLIDSSINPGSSINFVEVSIHPVPSVPGAGAVFSPVMVVGGDRLDPGGGKEGPIAGLNPDPASAPGGFNDLFLAVAHPLTLNDFKYHFNVPDNNQPDNLTCGPTSAANSLRWLGEKFGFNDKLPASDAQIINDLKSNTYMKTGPPDGTLDGNFVNGKQKYINDKKLPVVQKFKDGNTTINGQAPSIPDFKFIWDELKAGEDIELGFTFTPGKGGHWVTLVGGAHWSDDTYYIYINDPGDKEQRTKRYQLKKRPSGYLEICGYGKGHFMDIVVSESFDERVPAIDKTWGQIKDDYR